MQKLKGLGKRLAYLIISVTFTAIFATLIQTQRVIGLLDNIGANISLNKRVSMSVYDVSHLGTLYAIFIFIAFLIAFIASTGIYKITKYARLITYTVAGALAIFVMLKLMKLVFFDVDIIAGARDNVGILLQSIIGGFGGFIYAVLSTPHPAKRLF